MKEIPMETTTDYSTDKYLYNYLVVDGWVVILKDNRPVNYVADCGDLSTTMQYYFVDAVFARLCQRWPNTGVVTIINAMNNLNEELYKS